MVVDARTDMDPDVIREEQRQFSAVQSTVRETEASGANRFRFVKSNLGRYPFLAHGKSPYVLFLVTPTDGNPYFQLQAPDFVYDKNQDPREIHPLIEANFRKNMKDPFFVVRDGSVDFENGRLLDSGGQGMNGHASAIEATLNVLNTPPVTAPSKSPAAV